MMMMTIDQQVEQRDRVLARVQQRDRALAEANRIRTARKQIKADLADGTAELAELIMDPPDVIFTAGIGEVLEWMPGIGHWRAGKILSNEFGGGVIVNRGVKLANLSHRTRERICKRITETAAVHVPV